MNRNRSNLLSYENFFSCMRISSLFVDFSLTMCQFSRAHHEEVVNMSWVDWCGKMLKDRKIFVSVLGLLVQVHNYSATTHTP